MLAPYRNLIFGAVMLAFVAVLIFGGVREQSMYRVTHAAVVPPAVVPPSGGRLTIHYKSRAVRTCPTDVEVSIFNSDGVVVWRHRGVAANLSEDWRAQVNIPPLAVGSYEYHTLFRTKCAEDRQYAWPAPAVKFDVQ